MKKLRKGYLAALAILGSCGALMSTAIADSPFTDAKEAVEYRKDALSLMHANFAVMGDMVKGDIEYDPDIFQQRANDFAKLAGIPWAGFTVEGAMPGEDTDALPAIWDNWDDFQERANDLQTGADKLLAVSANRSLDSSGDALKDVARTCKGCHDDYRD
ncbi:Cytochrome c556 [Pseudidiomarina planktonica]|uniref:Cytochrome c556 n=1 Tax=Pseudidiomarina planktonica TaxID=1323738 RepID=A0A1Y6F2V2_9GAMM|nr:cytochrome c [Pseudidiomarina planktonica]SMQ67650.1 Cytochrome c556 [Pseudidiomarina planktonica]